MTSRGIIEAERRENLEAFEDAFAKLEGVTEEHVATLRKAPTSRPGSHYPQSDDPLGQAAYTAAALRGLAEAVAALQGNEAKRAAAKK
jgi:methyl coenzyme M reductase gamma subunit